MTAKSLQGDSGLVKGDELPDLKSLRESRGLSLENVFQATRISLKNLEAIESGDFRSLPSPIFSRGFLKAYANLVGLDAGPLIIRYEKYLAVAKQAVKGKEERPEGKSDLSNKIMFQAAIPVVICVLGLFVYGYFHFRDAPVAIDAVPLVDAGRPAEDIQKIAPPVNPEISVPAPAEKAGGGGGNSRTHEAQPALVDPGRPGAVDKGEPKKAASAPSSPGQAGRNTAVLIVIAREETWLRIREGEAPPYQVLMQPGERIERSALQYALDIGNAGGVSVEYQGNIMNELGKSGEVVHLRLP